MFGLEAELEAAPGSSINRSLHVISINKLHFPSSISAAIQQPDLHDVSSTWNLAILAT